MSVKIIICPQHLNSSLPFVVISLIMLFHFSFKQNHTMGGLRYHPHFTEEFGPRNLPKHNGTFYCPMIHLKNRNGKYLCNGKEPKLKPRPTGSRVWALSPTVLHYKAVYSSQKHSAGVPAVQTREAEHPRVQTTLTLPSVRTPEKPFVIVKQKYPSDRIYPFLLSLIIPPAFPHCFPLQNPRIMNVR